MEKKAKDEARWLLPGTGFLGALDFAHHPGFMLLGLAFAAVLILGYYRSASNPTVLPFWLSSLCVGWTAQSALSCLVGWV